MYHSFTRLKVLFVIVFVAISAGLWAYDALYVWPRKACEQRGDWWDTKDRVCAIPTPLTFWTGRPNVAPKPLGPPTTPPAAAR